ncbi:Hypothetical_protein [Hexamita inflata]|uniref:Hypothetical_protein n=1 Tax=Hexamita inflata TaxID=28002 RepID=A0AA86PZL7_9EUKA|nr:Hypothetical protein HINF_LOCUS34692 [Hexamita inflata]
MPLLAAAYQLLRTQRTVQTNLEISAGIGNKNSPLNFVTKKIVNSSIFSILQLGLSFPAWFIECNVSDVFSIALFPSPLRSLCVSYKLAQLDNIIGIILKLLELYGAKSCNLMIIQLLSNIASQNYLIVCTVIHFKRKNRFTKSCKIKQRRAGGLVELLLMLYFEFIFGTSFLFASSKFQINKMEYCWLRQINRHWKQTIINRRQPEYINLVFIDRFYHTIQRQISSYVCEVAKYFNHISLKQQLRKDTLVADHCNLVDSFNGKISFVSFSFVIYLK